MGAGKSTGVQGAAGGCREPQGCTVRQAEAGGELSEGAWAASAERSFGRK